MEMETSVMLGHNIWTKLTHQGIRYLKIKHWRAIHVDDNVTSSDRASLPHSLAAFNWYIAVITMHLPLNTAMEVRNSD